MTWTRHGHHIPGSALEDEDPSWRARCGGPAFCTECSLEARLWKGRNKTVVLPPTNTEIKSMNHQEMAKLLVAQYFNKKAEKTDVFTITTAEVYVVWFTYTLGNWKALLSTTVNDGMYYEVTYDRVNERTYLDAYKKWENVVIPDGEVLHKFTN